MRRSPCLGLTGLAVLMMAAPARSQQSATAAVQQILLPRIQPAGTLDKFLENLRADFFIVDADGDGQITEQDIDLHTLMEGIQVRTQGIASVMRYDLDADGSVTEDEIRRGMRYEQRSQLGLATVNKQQPAAGELLTKQ